MGRCHGCGKVAFRTREKADAARARIKGEVGRERMRTYLGCCGSWHLARIKTMNEIREKLRMLPEQEG